jgi:hypothetical protein
MKNFKNKRILLPTRSILAILATAAALTGCGPNIVGEEPVSDHLRSPDSFQYTMSGGYSCPTEANVTPYEDRVFDGTQRYTVCTHPTTTTKIRISGQSSTDPMVCVYPLQFLNESQFVYKVGPTGAPLYTCYNARTSPTKDFDFLPSVIFDGLVIVDQADQANMSRCLMSGATCPTYSLGRFR